jgi:hypothetical protein
MAVKHKGAIEKQPCVSTKKAAESAAFSYHYFDHFELLHLEGIAKAGTIGVIARNN